jgi:hypothetical protein
MKTILEQVADPFNINDGSNSSTDPFLLKTAPEQTNPPTVTTNVFACIEAAHTSGIVYTADRTQLHITRTNGSKHIFINDYKFIYLHNNVKHGGAWSCVGPTSYKITLKNGQTYSPNVDEWLDKPEVVEVPPSNGKAELTKKSEGAKTNVITKSENNKAVYGTDAIIY